MSKKYDKSLIDAIGKDVWVKIFKDYTSFQDRASAALVAKQFYFLFQSNPPLLPAHTISWEEDFEQHETHIINEADGGKIVVFPSGDQYLLLNNKTVSLKDVASNKLLQSLDFVPKSVVQVFALNDDTFGTVHEDNKIFAWSIKNKKCLGEAPNGTYASHSDQLIVTVSDDSAFVYDVRKKNEDEPDQLAFFSVRQMNETIEHGYILGNYLVLNHIFEEDRFITDQSVTVYSLETKLKVFQPFAVKGSENKRFTSGPNKSLCYFEKQSLYRFESIYKTTKIFDPSEHNDNTKYSHCYPLSPQHLLLTNTPRYGSNDNIKGVIFSIKDKKIVKRLEFPNDWGFFKCQQNTGKIVGIKNNDDGSAKIECYTFPAFKAEVSEEPYENNNLKA